ncbi:glutamate receptor ionotropic, kainate 5-like [Centruroides vittatus]|uniref:glutamate receptor ionotropic, kainate 5-like n=1 Tax=Centruroides vittatus TaxID=120091 RepID=UPI0035106986
MEALSLLLFLNVIRLLTAQYKNYSYSTLCSVPKSDFNSKTLRVTSLSKSDEVFYNCTESCEVFRFSFAAIDFLAEVFNFSYQVVKPEDNTFGIKEIINGTVVWNGMIKMLANGEADLAAGLFFITEERKEAIDFSLPIINDRMGLITLSPKEAGNYKALYAPFDKNVWIILIITSFIMVPIIYGCLRMDRYMRNDTNPEHYFTFSDCIWFVFSGLVKQGTPRLPQFNLARILFATWWFFTLLLTSIYSAKLAAYLTLPSFHIIENLDAVLENPSLKWIIQYGHAIDGLIQNPTSSVFQKLQTSMKKGFGIKVNSTEEAMALVLKGGHVYIQEITSLKQIMLDDYKKTGRCRFIKSSYEFFDNKLAFGFAKGNNYSQHLNALIYCLKAAGFIQKWNQRYLVIPDVCRLSSDLFLRAEDKKLNLLNLSPAFYLLAAGLSLGFITLLCEIFIFSRKKNSVRSQSYTINTKRSNKTDSEKNVN